MHAKQRSEVILYILLMTTHLPAGGPPACRRRNPTPLFTIIQSFIQHVIGHHRGRPMRVVTAF